ncbi:MAG: isoprenylcysteine carboxylmethyltransferase family protein [bacterium]
MAASVSIHPASPGRPTWSRRLGFVQDALLVCTSALFFYVHGLHAYQTHTASSVFFAAEQGLLVWMFLTRRRSQATSQRPWDWVVATFGGWLPLAMQPHDSGGFLQFYGVGMQMLGLTCVIVSFSTLGRSFGVVAANRGLKVGGPYRFVRHPIYFSHSVTLLGFVIANLYWFNISILIAITVFQVLRIAAEERILTETSDYAAYKERVRWRLVPGLY